MVLELHAWISYNHEVQKFTGKPYEGAIFDFIRQLFFQNDVFKIQEVFSELAIRVFLENGLGSFQTFLISQI
jgi:hypothetical protein